jgi:hypothetical protein
MDISLIALLILSIALVFLHAPKATLMMVVIVAISVVTTRLFWGALRALEPAPARVSDRQRTWD